MYKNYRARIQENTNDLFKDIQRDSLKSFWVSLVLNEILDYNKKYYSEPSLCGIITNQILLIENRKHDDARFLEMYTLSVIDLFHEYCMWNNYEKVFENPDNFQMLHLAFIIFTSYAFNQEHLNVLFSKHYHFFLLCFYAEIKKNPEGPFMGYLRLRCQNNNMCMILYNYGYKFSYEKHMNRANFFMRKILSCMLYKSSSQEYSDELYKWLPSSEEFSEILQNVSFQEVSQKVEEKILENFHKDYSLVSDVFFDYLKIE